MTSDISGYVSEETTWSDLPITSRTTQPASRLLSDTTVPSPGSTAPTSTQTTSSSPTTEFPSTVTMPTSSSIGFSTPNDTATYGSSDNAFNDSTMQLVAAVTPELICFAEQCEGPGKV